MDAVELCELGGSPSGVCSTSRAERVAITVGSGDIVEYDGDTRTRVRSWNHRELGGAATGPIAYCKDTLFAAIRSPKGEHEVAVITLKENQTTDEDVDDAPTTSGTDPAARVRLGAETRHIAAATHRSAVLVACADGTVHLVSVSGSIKASESLDSSRSILASATRARDGALVLLSSLPKAPGSVRIDVFAVQEASPGNDRIVRLLSGPVVAPDGAGSPVAVAVSSDEAHVLWSSGAFQSVAVPASHASAQHADVPVVFARAFTGFVPAGCSPVGAPAESRKRGRTEPGNAVGKVLAATSAGHVVVFGRAKGDSAELGKDGDAAVVLFDTKHACVHAVVKMPDVQAACSGIWVLVEEFERGAVVLAVGAERSVQTVTLALGAPSLARALALRRDGVDCQRVIFGREGGGRLAAGVVAAPVAVKAVVKDVEVGEGDLAGDEGDVAPLAECPLNLQRMSEYEAGFRNALGKVEGAGTPESLGTAVTGLLKIHADNSVPIGPTAAAVVVQRAASLKAWSVLSDFLPSIPAATLAPARWVPEAVFESGDFLLLHSLLRASTALPSASIAALLEGLLGGSKRQNVVSERRSGRAKGPQARPEAAFKEAALAAAEQVVEQSSQEIGDGSLSPLQVESVAAVCAASLGAREACVAALLSMDLDQAAALSALEALPARSVLRLLRLLNRCLGLYLEHPVLTSFSPAMIPALPWPLVLPSVPSLTLWAGCALDGHLPKILLHGGALREAALGLRSTVSLLSAASRCAAELEGHVAHVLEGAPLPVPRNTLAAVYHVEALSLQIEG